MLLRHLVSIGAILLVLLSIFCCCENDVQAKAPPQAAGYVAGDFHVNNNGAAVYEISLEVPPGTNHFQPNLKLSYNNQKDNGLLGLGWSLSGLSSISRCSRTIAQDGVNGGINFDGKDRFCADGMRLMLVRGAAYGADGTEYRTEQEQWTRYYARGTCGGGPCSFIAQTKDGSLISFAGTKDSRITAQGRDDIRVWAVDKKVDRNGNYLSVSYTTSTESGEYYPAKIQYTGNEHSGLTPGRRVVFGYRANRPDSSVSYIGGSKVTRSVLLDRIATYVGSDLVKEYRIDYLLSEHTRQSTLSKLEECSGGGECLAPTTFTWSNVFSSRHTFDLKSWGQQASWSAGSTRIPGDFNADGFSDIAYLYNNAGKVAMDVYLSTGNSFIRSSWFSDKTMWNSGEFAAGDYNGDGVTDIANVYNEAGFIGIDTYISDRKSFIKKRWYSSRHRWSTEARVLVGDFNGDGQTDLAYSFNNAGKLDIKVFLSTGKSFLEDTGLSASGGPWLTDGHLSTGDFNGDGVTDLAYVFNDSGKVGITTYTSTVKQLLKRSFRLDNLNWVDDNLFSFSDYNGDGVTDICYFYNENRYINAVVMLAGGDDFIPRSWSTSGKIAWRGAKIIKSADYNGDSLTDVAYVYKDDNQKISINTFLSTGKEFIPFQKEQKEARWSNEVFLVSNFRGSGRADIINLFNSNGNLGFLLYASRDDGTGPSLPLRQSDLLTTIVSGIKERVEIAYKPLTDSSIYQISVDSPLFPIMNVQVPYYVVAKTVIAEPVSGAMATAEYSYAGARVDLQGRGWLGFEKMSKRNSTDPDPSMQTDTTSFFYQNFPLTGLLQQRLITRVYDGALLWSSAFAYDYVDSPLSSAVGRIAIVFKESKESKFYSNGIYNYSLNKLYHYDSAHKVLTRIDSVDSHGKGSTVCRQYLQAGSSPWWQTFFKIAQKESTADTDCGDIHLGAWLAGHDLRWYQYGYDDNMNLTTIKTWNDQPGQWSVETRRYDIYGNITSTTDPAGNISRIEYDPLWQTFPEKYILPPAGNGTASLIYQKTFEPKFGKLVTHVDANGNTVMAIPKGGLDGFGRLVKKTTIGAADGKLVPTWSRTYSQGDVAGVKVTTRQREDWSDDDEQDWFWESKDYDGLGRVYRDSSKGPASNKQIVTAKDFNDQGLVGRNSLPYFSDEKADYISYQYDISKRKVKTTFPDGVVDTVVFDPSDHREVSYISPNPADTLDKQTAVTNRISRDNHGRVLTNQAVNGGKTTYSYDVLGQLLQETDPLGMVTSYSYTSLGHVAEIISPTTGSTKYLYNNSGKIDKIINGLSETTVYSYDALWRISKVDWYDSSQKLQKSLSYSYDTGVNGKGLLATITAPEISYSFGYDYVGNVATKTVTMAVAGSATEYLFSYEYDPLKRPTKTILPDGSSISYSYFPQGGTYQVVYNKGDDKQGTTLVTYHNYDAMGDLLEANFGNGIVTTSSYDVLGRLQNKKTGHDSVTLHDFHYNWNKASKILAISDVAPQPNASPGQFFSYDEMGFLTSASGGYGDKRYAYNQTGDLIAEDALRYIYDDSKRHQLVSGCRITGDSCEQVFSIDYDDIGNQTDKTVVSSSGNDQWTYVYDAGKNLIEVTKNIHDGKVAEKSFYSYGIDWQRVKKVSGDKKTSYYISPDYIVHHNSNQKTSVTKYITSEHGTIAMMAGPATTYFHLNLIGSSSFLTDEQGVLQDTLQYEPFGLINLAASRVSTDFTPKFTGKELDEDTDLYYFGARYYDPALGRFLSPDPARQFASPYIYAGNDPIAKADPDGRIAGIDDALELAIIAEVSAEIAVETASSATAVAVSTGEATAAMAAAIQTEAEVSAIAVTAAIDATGVGIEAAQAEVIATITADSIISGGSLEETTVGVNTAMAAEESETTQIAFADNLMEDDSSSSLEEEENFETGDRGKGEDRIRQRRRDSVHRHNYGRHRVYTSTGRMTDTGVRNAISDTSAGERVLLLSGTHGDVTGATAAEDTSLEDSSFYRLDRRIARRFMRGTPGRRISVINVGDGRTTTQEVNRAISDGVFRGRRYTCVIGAFCYSEVRYNNVFNLNPERVGGSRLAR